ncbi:pirin family protein [Ideonella sp. A 288]|uniref:pirin family protein n=1 Tax=Ideonella sp. A 288 TaxID=1962181 RepID=UPI000B4ACA51|nr:pirin family protein [Ideonella sp. A 288]
MITLRRADERGLADLGWLVSRHSFSFSDYHDPAHMGFGNLRVINEDRIAPGTGFGTHGHRDMEIVSYVLEGALAHRDSIGNGTAIVPGEVQRMTAGTGVRHSEFNHAEQATTHFLQIWLLPAAAGLAPGYEQKAFAPTERRGRLRLVGAPDGRDGAVTLHADALLYAGLFDGPESARLVLPPGRLGYVFLARGMLTVNGRALSEGDAAAFDGEPAIELSGGQGAEVLVFELAPR